MIFMRIDLPNFVLFKQHQGKGSGLSPIPSPSETSPMAVFKLGSPGSIQTAADIVSSRVIDRYLSDSTRQRQHQVEQSARESVRRMSLHVAAHRHRDASRRARRRRPS